MLILGRRRDESVEVTVDGVHRVTVKVLSHDGGRVRLGFTADDDVTFLRTELESSDERPAA